jgi:hypothetical protein
MTRMGKIYRENFGNMRIPENQPRDINEDYIIRAKKLRRVNIGSRSRVIGASEEEIQDIKQGLDTNILLGKREKESKKQLKRLGFLFG